ncbi:hypothetical protein EV659_101180 [Rhodothalassium salexigens DSM 2132]|uniref:Uncharacterized protein n=1 Tax=Rhodothalassium salexigens DSM 2132 TaxID=1188247 RepID=A0A4R2PR16_RHOSA|nr:hypothetical protein [Rhodothalassium salexigens]MBB4210117.1 tetratricopeptide (TPR) repeat protein [Rhodothalassium salexigens DSM 2132]TCP38282.1 hypothetical protein EV659_101180 [Rhodothalassium salexigens DSM 2132]
MTGVKTTVMALALASILWSPSAARAIDDGAMAVFDAVIDAAPAGYRQLDEPDDDPLEAQQEQLEARLAEDDNRDTRLALVRVLRDRGKAKKGLKVLSPLLEAAPNDEALQQVRNDLMVTWVRNAGVFGKMRAGGRFKEACEADLARDPENGTALLCLARYYENAPAVAGGSQDQARALLDRLETVDRHGYWMMRAELLGDEDLDARSAAYAKAIAARPDRQAMLFAAKWHIKQGVFGDAFTYLARVLDQQPDNRMALYQLGRTAARSGDRLAAGEAALLRFLAGPTRLRGDDYRARAHAYLGYIYGRQGDVGAAKRAFDRALALDDKLAIAAEGRARLARQG